MKIRRTKVDAEAAHADFLHQLHSKGVTLSEEDTKFIQDKGLLQVAANVINDDGEEDKVQLKLETIFRSNKILNPIEAEADKRICVIQPKPGQMERMLKPGRVMTAELHRRELDECAIFFGEARKISKADWMPESIDEHTEEFKEWIDSICCETGFWTRKNYSRFNLYVQQAEAWGRDHQTPDMTDEEWQMRELHRMDENSLYALNACLHIQESNKSAVKKYVATPAHQIILYLLDCGYSADAAKARQIAFTTTIAGRAMIKAMLSYNYKIKYISENVEKAESTIAEKLKYPFSKMPAWSRPKVLNDWLGGIYFADRIAKGVIEGNNSVVEVLPPTETAVASSTPDETYVDEIGQIESIQSIEGDVEPTLYGYNPTTGKQERLRMYWQWGTGGNMNGKAGIAFQASYLNHLQKWKETNNATIIPLFFNVWWRPGWSKERQEALRKAAYAQTGPEAERARIKFHQSYPETLDDVFKQGGDTIISEEYIQECLKRIRSAGQKAAPVYGRFEPIYDTNSPAHEGSDVQWKITGAQFVPLKKGDHDVTTVIFMNRQPWRNRYYQGTDPISSKSGLSDMASCIWDAYFSCPTAVTFCRTQGDPRKDFLQTMLLGMYYDIEGKGAVPELVEANIGGSYIEYKTNKGLEKTLVLESQLPEALQSSRGSIGIGIDNKGGRNDLIVSQMKNIFLTYGSKIYLDIFFIQARTFVQKLKNNTTVWEPIDKRINRDDTLFALTYSYICALCFLNRKPEPLKETTTMKTEMQYKLMRQANGQLKGQWKKVQVKNIRPEIVR